MTVLCCYQEMWLWICNTPDVVSSHEGRREVLILVISFVSGIKSLFACISELEYEKYLAVFLTNWISKLRSTTQPDCTTDVVFSFPTSIKRRIKHL